MNLELIEAAEKVLEGFKVIVAKTAEAEFEEKSPYEVVAGGLVQMGIDLDDSRIASHLSPTAQLIEKLTEGRAEGIVEPDGYRGRPQVKLFNRSGRIILSLPAALADIEAAWWAGTLPDYLSAELAVEGGLRRDPYWDFPQPVSDGDRW
jgi:hypothetical protein